MDLEKIKSLSNKMKVNKEKLKKETGNSKNQQILRLKIKIDELQIQIEKLK
jgi:hypothetical protein